VALGGVVAVHLGWRWSFAAMAVFGLVLVALYRIFISDEKLLAYRHADSAPTATGPQQRARLSSLFSTPAVILAYVGSGLQLFVAGSLYAWLPSFLNRSYGMAPDRAAGVAALFILVMGVGMIVCGAVTDRLTRVVAIRKWTTAIVYVALSLVLVGLAFSMAPGPVQLILLALGGFFVAGTTGPAGAMVANLTPESIRATAFGTLTLANNLLGLAAGPFVTGLLADRFGLEVALGVVPLVSVLALVALIAGRRAYPSSLERVTNV
jgi:predicted MFS family arabinose efflux permease